MANSCHEDEISPFLPLHPLKPGRTDAPIKTLEKANSYHLKLTSSANLTANNTVAALLIDGNGVNLGGAFTLTVGTAGAGLVVNRGGDNTISATTLAFGSLEPMFLVETGSSLNVASSMTGTNALRKERGGNLILSGDNLAFGGSVTINSGTLTARHSNALGGIYEAQTITVATTVTTFTVSFGAETTSILTRATLTAAQLQTALVHPLKPGRTDAPIKTLEKANSYHSFNSIMPVRRAKNRLPLRKVPFTCTTSIWILRVL